MFARFARVVATLAICYSIGGDWIALQSIAWTTMLIDYSHQCSFKQAIVHTFDGAHPCDMCKHISKGKASQKNPERVVVAPKADLICATAKRLSRPSFVLLDYPERTISFPTTFHQPAAPPPRATLS